MKWIGMIAMLILVAGCIPGEAEFTITTSNMRKALLGEVAQVRVHETMSWTLSNAYDKVSFSGKFTNKLDVVKAMVEGARHGGDWLGEYGGHSSMFGLKDDGWTNDTLNVWVEERLGELPNLRMAADVCLALGLEESLHKRSVKQKTCGELFTLKIDAETGRISFDYSTAEKGLLNLRLLEFASSVRARIGLLSTLFGDGERDLLAVDSSLYAVIFPNAFKQTKCYVIGDCDEPLYVIAEDVRVDGQMVKRFEGFVKKGEKVRFELDMDVHREDGGLGFFLKNRNATEDVIVDRDDVK